MKLVQAGHLLSQLRDTRNMSSRLLATPFGLNHVNFFPTQGISSSSTSAIHLLKSWILLASAPLWDTPSLSEWCLMLLKSLMKHHKPSGSCCLNCLSESHKIRFCWLSHGEYMLTTQIFWFSWVHTPSNRIKPLPISFLSSLKTCSFQTHSNPPAVFIAGWNSQPTSGSPYKAWHTALSISSLLVSWMQISVIWVVYVAFVPLD